MKQTRITPGVLILVAMMICLPAFSKPAKKAEKNIGIQLYSLRDDIKKDFDKTVTAVGSMGYKYVEAASYDNGKFYSLSPEVFKAKIKAAGMTALSSHTSYSLPVEKMEEIDWNEVWQWWDVCIDAHKAAGMSYIAAPSMPRANKFKNIETLKAYCDYYNKIGAKCKAKGLKFGYHNHSFEFEKVDDQVMYNYLIENTDPSLVFFEMDVYWVVRGGESPVEYFEKYPGRFEILHIKDHKELGQSGMVGFDAIFNHIDKAGTKYLIVEVEKYNYSPEESVKRSLDYLLNADFVKKDYSK